MISMIDLPFFAAFFGGFSDVKNLPAGQQVFTGR
jgi:hypothetical protein